MNQTAWNYDQSEIRAAAVTLGALAVTRAISEGVILAFCAARLPFNQAGKAEYQPYLVAISQAFLSKMTRSFGVDSVRSVGPDALLTAFQVGWVRTAGAIHAAQKRTRRRPGK